MPFKQCERGLGHRRGTCFAEHAPIHVRQELVPARTLVLGLLQSSLGISCCYSSWEREG